MVEFYNWLKKRATIFFVNNNNKVIGYRPGKLAKRQIRHTQSMSSDFILTQPLFFCFSGAVTDVAVYAVLGFIFTSKKKQQIMNLFFGVWFFSLTF